MGISTRSSMGSSSGSVIPTTSDISENGNIGGGIGSANVEVDVEDRSQEVADAWLRLEALQRYYGIVEDDDEEHSSSVEEDDDDSDDDDDEVDDDNDDGDNDGGDNDENIVRLTN